MGLSRSSSRRALRHLAAEHLGVNIQTGEHCPVSLSTFLVSLVFFYLITWLIKLLVCWVNGNCLCSLKNALAWRTWSCHSYSWLCKTWYQKSKISILFQIEDARAAMLLYQRNKKEWEKSIKDQFRLKQKQRKSKQKKKLKNEHTSNGNHVEIWS